MKRSDADERIDALLSGENLRTNMIDALSEYDTELLRAALRRAQEKGRRHAMPASRARTHERLAASALTPLVLFHAYCAALSERKHDRIAFGRTYAIAVSDDPIAKRWQRRNRQVRKIENRLSALLGDADALDLLTRLCPLCGFYASQCKHTEKGE